MGGADGKRLTNTIDGPVVLGGGVDIVFQNGQLFRQLGVKSRFVGDIVR